jgi:hypothetical protein
MAQMRIAGEIIQIQQETPAPKPTAKRGRPSKKDVENVPASDQASPQS